MALVPADQAAGQPTLPAPAVHHKVSNLDRKLQEILDNKATSQHERVRQFRETLDSYLHYLDSAKGGPAVTVKPERALTEQSGQHSEHNEENLQDIVAVMSARPDVLSYSPSGEIIYHGHPIPGTNVLDIIQQQLYPQELTPPGNDLFMSALDEVREMDQSLPNQEEWEYSNEPVIRDALSRNDIQRILRLERLGRRVKSPVKRYHAQSEEDDIADIPPSKRLKLTMLKLKSKIPRRVKNRPQVPKPKPIHNLSISRKLEKRGADKIELRPIGPRAKYMKFTPKPLQRAKLPKPVRRQAKAAQTPSRKRSSDKVELRFESSRPKYMKFSPKSQNTNKRSARSRRRQRWSSL